MGAFDGMVDLRLGAHPTPFVVVTTNEGTDIGTVSGFDALVQAIRLTLDIWEGEWFWEPGEGVPMHGAILGARATVVIFKAFVQSVLEALPGYVETQSLSVEQNGREFSATFQVLTSLGVIDSTQYPPFVVVFEGA